MVVNPRIACKLTVFSLDLIASSNRLMSTISPSFRATGITNYMSHGGRIDVAKEMAGHADERTTGLYDRSSDKMTKEEVERMRFEREG